MKKPSETNTKGNSESLRSIILLQEEELRKTRRQLEIEASLERVRTLTMVMKQSDELSGVIATVYKELRQLDVALTRTLIWLFSENPDTFEVRMADSEADTTLFVMKTVVEHPYHKRIFQKWKEGYSKWVHVNEGEGKQDLDDYLFNKTVAAALPEEVKAAIRATSKIVNSFSFQNFGALQADGEDKLSEENFEILHRFAKEFDLAYTRFLDLQKAEAQAREAQIETALEKVRSRSLAMHKAEELGEVATVIFEKLKELDMPVDEGVSIVTHLEGSKDQIEWMESPDHTSALKVYMPYHDHPVLDDYWKAKEKGLDFIAPSYTKEESRSFFKHIFEFTDYRHTPQEIKDYCLAAKTYSYFAAFQKNSSIFINDFSGRSLSEHEIDVVKRFSKVFEQAYVRFLDLQKAEAQAREAVRQASLERVRGQIASMRSKEDLNRITPLIWMELKSLEVPFIRCGVFIMDRENEIIKSYLSDPDGKTLGIFDLPYHSETIGELMVDFWQKKKIYKEHWSKDQFLKFMGRLMNAGRLKDPGRFQGAEKPPEKLDLHFIPFKQGMLYVGNNAPLSKEKLLLVQSLADAFSIAYARYEDFRQLEEAKTQIEKTLDELRSTQTQLIHSEKMASLGELTAGIAHEIQNPLNFVNNFSEVSKELIEELNEERSKQKGKRDEDLEEEIISDIIQNIDKINHHGNRASSIVKGMLEHSRSGNHNKELTDINTLADEYLRLAYHGLRAKDQTFNAEFRTELDPALPKVKVIGQDIGRVLLNLINNAFYAVARKNKEYPTHYNPEVVLKTKNNEKSIEITVQDNGEGIPEEIRNKIFQPFFTTKPAGEGTGLGLSLTYDIITKGHGGNLKVDTKEGFGTAFTVQLPIE